MALLPSFQTSTKSESPWTIVKIPLANPLFAGTHDRIGLPGNRTNYWWYTVIAS